MNLPWPLGGFLDGFAVGDLRLADVGFHLELALHAVDEDVEVQLAHALEDGLTGLLVGVDAEGGVFLGQALEGVAHLFLVGLGLGLDGDGDDGLGEGDGFENDGVSRSVRVLPVVVFLRPTARRFRRRALLGLLRGSWRASARGGRCAPSRRWRR
jgi:hypothetical protein